MTWRAGFGPRALCLTPVLYRHKWQIQTWNLNFIITISLKLTKQEYWITSHSYFRMFSARFFGYRAVFNIVLRSQIAAGRRLHPGLLGAPQPRWVSGLGRCRCTTKNRTPAEESWSHMTLCWPLPTASQGNRLGLFPTMHFIDLLTPSFKSLGSRRNVLIVQIKALFFSMKITFNES